MMKPYKLTKYGFLLFAKLLLLWLQRSPHILKFASIKNVRKFKNNYECPNLDLVALSLLSTDAGKRTGKLFPVYT